jgi:hypothetical protein
VKTRFSRPIALVGMLLGLAGVTSPASAALLAYEGFDYAPGTLVGQNGGIGFSNAWGTTTGSAAVQAPGLGYGALATTGNKLFMDGAAGTVQTFRNITSQRGTDGTTTWISLITERTGQKGGTFGQGGAPSYLRPLNVSFYQLPIGGTGNGSEIFAVGEGTRNQPPPAFDEDVLGFLVGGSVANAATRWTTAPVDNESFLLVRIDHGAANADTAYMWVNPDLSVEPTLGSAMATTTGNFNFNRVRPFAGNPSAEAGNIAAQGTVDELRIGDTWADVTPIPEPASFTLLGLSALLMTRRGRRNA